MNTMCGVFRSEMPDVTYLRLDGGVPPADRQSIVNRFVKKKKLHKSVISTYQQIK